MRFATVKKADRTYDLPIATVRIVAAQSRVLVPTGRFELPHLAALAPQASVSTSFTTSAISLKRPRPGTYFAGCGAGAAGGGTTAGAAGTVTPGSDLVFASSASSSTVRCGAVTWCAPR